MAQQLWQKTAVGMSPAQISTIFPEAHASDTITSRSGKTGQYWQIDKTDIAGHPGKVSFYFEEEKLQFVQIYVGGAENMSELDSLTAQSYIAMLNKEYGTPTDCSPIIHGEFIGKSCTWFHGPVEIGLQEVGTDSAGMAIISYKPATKSGL